jgi:hypothetical protein
MSIKTPENEREKRVDPQMRNKCSEIFIGRWIE